jgi:predicted aspartyl protease
MKRNNTFIVLFFVFCFGGKNNLFGIPEQLQIIRDFSEAIQAKDTALLKNSVSANFAVATVTWPASRNYMQIIFDRETFDSIVPIAGKIKAVNNSFKQKTEAIVYVRGKDPIKTNITFDARDGKILHIDYFDELFGMFRNRPSRLMAVLPIEQEEHSRAIIVYLKLNNYDKTLRFLFDTGADGMAISSELAEKIGVAANRSQHAGVVGGSVQVQISSGNTVLLDTFRLRNQNIAIFPKVRDGIDGLIGLNLAQNFIVKVNLDEKKMYLYSFGTFDYEDEGETESITVPRGIINIPGKLNLSGKKDVEGDFIFDSGAEYYLMGFSHWVRKNRLLLSGWKHENQATTVSMGIATPTYEGKAYEFKVGNFIKETNMPVSLQASTGNNNNFTPPADGSMGVKLITQYNFTINLLEKEIHFSRRK